MRRLYQRVTCSKLLISSNIHPSSLVSLQAEVQREIMESNSADVSGLPVNIPVVKEATALGCAIAAGVGAGIFHQWQKPENARFAGNGRNTPDPEKHELYQDSRDKWQAVYPGSAGAG